MFKLAEHALDPVLGEKLIAEFVNEVGREGESAIICPECGNDYIHPTGVIVNPCGKNGGSAKITSNGIEIDREDKNTTRGVAIQLRFWCENHHEFVWTIHFHKGNTSISVSHGKMPDVNSVIWRD